MIDQLRLEYPDLFAAPELPPWPTGLPKALETPEAARCAAGGTELGEGSWVPRARGRATQQLLLTCRTLPGQCRDVINAIVPRVVTAIVDQVGAAPPAGFSLQTVVVWALTGLAVGAATTALLVVTR